ncbi:DUF4390 domain-containing protein [bacterium]|nr:MAG: DUF4390 domain-containing protein [bacterium]
MIPHSSTRQFSIFIVFLFNFLIPGIEITQIIPYQDSNELKCDVVVNDLFNSKTHSVLLSGIPLHIVIPAKLRGVDKNQVMSNETEIILYYDVWDEMFTLKQSGIKEQIPNLDSLKNRLNLIRGIPVSKLPLLEKDQSFYISMKIHVYNERSGSLIDSISQASSNKKFSLGAIINFFFGKSEPDDHWYHSDKFKLSELKPN